MRKYGLRYVVVMVGVLLLPFSAMAQSPIRTESLPPTPDAPEEQPAEEGAVRATLDAQVRPAQVPRSAMGSIELEATKVPKPPLVETANGKGWFIAVVVFLVISILGNILQYYRHSLYGKTISNQLVSAFNSIAWSLARCLNKTKELDERLKGQKITDPVLLKEYREFTVDSEFNLRTLREQLVSVARNVSRDDKRWVEAQLGHTPDEIEKMRNVMAGRSMEGSGNA